MPFADRDAGLPVQKYDAAVHIVRDQVTGQFKAIIVSDLAADAIKPVADEVRQFCSDPKSVVLTVSTNMLINWVEI
jgi:hypothetical protein